MKSIYLVEYFNNDGSYSATSIVALTSKKAANKYAALCNPMAIKKITLFSSKDF